jgi:hypothetical protein
VMMCMIEMSEPFSQGTVLLIMTFPWPWPCPTRTQLVRRGPAVIFAEPNGSLGVQITTDEKVFEFQSCRLVLDGQTSTNVGVSWCLPHAVNMIVGKAIVLSTENSELVPVEAHIPSGVPNDVRDFSKQNADALGKRHNAFARYGAEKKLKVGRRDATADEIFDALQRAQQQITELLSLVGEGKVHHVDGLLRLLRFTVADRTAEPLPLLQLCAAMTDAPLIVFAPPITALKDPPPMEGVETLAFPISAVATNLLKNAVDLDVWLESRAAQLDERVLSQKELINNIANTIAAHFDTQVRAETDLLRSWKSGIAGVDLDFVVHYTVAISAAVRDIITPILVGKPT